MSMKRISESDAQLHCSRQQAPVTRPYLYAWLQNGSRQQMHVHIPDTPAVKALFVNQHHDLMMAGNLRHRQQGQKLQCIFSLLLAAHRNFAQHHFMHQHLLLA